MPLCEQLSRMVGENPEAERIIRNIHKLAWLHADDLRIALKDRTVKPSRTKLNLPCWTP